MTISSEVMKKMGIRPSNDYERVFREFPIGHKVHVNGQPAVIIGHSEIEVYGSKCLWTQVKFMNADYMTVDPIFFNFEPCKVAETDEAEKQT